MLILNKDTIWPTLYGVKQRKGALKISTRQTYIDIITLLYGNMYSLLYVVKKNLRQSCNNKAEVPGFTCIPAFSHNKSVNVLTSKN